MNYSKGGSLNLTKEKKCRKCSKAGIFWVGTAVGFLQAASKRPLKLTLVEKPPLLKVMSKLLSDLPQPSKVNSNHYIATQKRGKKFFSLGFEPLSHTVESQCTTNELH